MARTQEQILADLRGKYEEQQMTLDPHEVTYVQLAASHLAAAEGLEGQVSRDGRMIPGGNRAGMFVLHPAIAEARMCREAAARILGKVRIPEEGASRSSGRFTSDSARHAAVVRHHGKRGA